MPTIKDEEFGEVTVRRSTRAKQVRLKVAADGTIRASLPTYAPLFLVKRLIKQSRNELRAIIDKARPASPYKQGMAIGKSHTLVVGYSSDDKFRVTVKDQRILVELRSNDNLNDPLISQAIQKKAIDALCKEAKSYLPRRLEYLARQHGFVYQKTRFSHATSRWGSCSTKGTISLNIAIMKLPHELIDYVLIHELVHTRHMNHSPDFWQTVGRADPNYKEHRKALKTENPSI